MLKNNFKLIIFTLLITPTSYAEKLTNLSLHNAIKIMKENNLELKISKFDEQLKKLDSNVVSGMYYGKLDAKIQALRSNDAGNVFGFKLKSREASFGDFGFNEFLTPLGGAISAAANGQEPSDMSGLLTVKPHDLNFPDSRNHYQTTLSYMVPLYTGGKLTQYQKISQALERMSSLDTSKLLNEKIFQTTKTFYDISLINQYVNKLSNIKTNIDKLENIVQSMKEEGFAKEIDELEVKTRKTEAQSMLSQANYNRELAYQYLSFLLNKHVVSIDTQVDSVAMPKIEKSAFLRDNLDIQQAKLGLEITEMAIEAEKANFLPTVGAFAEYGSADNKPFNNFQEKDFYTVGLQVEWNLFNGNIDKTNLAKAKVENIKVREQIDLAQKGTGLKIAKLQTEIKSKSSDIQNLEIQLEFAAKVYENYEERYQEGIASISDVLIKQSKELEVLLKLLTAKNDRNAKIFELNSILNQGNL